MQYASGHHVQVLNMSWRVGMGLDEASAVLEEGQTLARSIGDRIAEVHLSMVYARAVCGAGDVATYLDLAVRNERAALDVGDEAALTLARMWVVDALAFAALGSRPTNGRGAAALVARHVPAAQRIFGIEPHLVPLFWRGYCLVWMGRLGEGLDTLGRCASMADDDGTPEMAGYALAQAAEGYRLAHDVDRALATARRVEEISRRLGEPPVMAGMAALASGYAHLARRPAVR
jgi:hypothetical protein